PQAELRLVMNDPEVANTVFGFQIDRFTLETQWSALQAAPPLAWSDPLAAAALYHTNQMRVFDAQSHQLPGEPDLLQRAQGSGYDVATVGENIYAYANGPLYGHAGLAIDWGNTPSGIQDPPGHRQN